MYIHIQLQATSNVCILCIIYIYIYTLCRIHVHVYLEYMTYICNQHVIKWHHMHLKDPVGGALWATSQWIGFRENVPKTHGFLPSNIVVSCILFLKPIPWTSNWVAHPRIRPIPHPPQVGSAKAQASQFLDTAQETFAGGSPGGRWAELTQDTKRSSQFPSAAFCLFFSAGSLVLVSWRKCLLWCLNLRIFGWNYFCKELT